MAENAETVQAPETQDRPVSKPTGSMHDIARRLEAIKAPETEAPADGAPADGGQEAAAQADAQIEKGPEVTGVEEGADVDEGPTISTLAELAEHIGADLNEIYSNLAIPVTDTDGTRREVTLGEWKDAYQAAEKLKRTQSELAEQRSKLENQIRTSHESYQSRIREADYALQVAQQQVIGEWNEAEMAQLRHTDPAEWTARRTQLQERLGRLNQQRQALMQKAQAAEAERAREWQEQAGKLLEKEQQALVSAMGWKDEAQARTEKEQLAKYLKEAGQFKDEEISNLYDHRVAVLANKARLWDESQKQAKAAAKKLKIAPKKNLKPGAAQAKADSRDDRLAELRGRVRKTGSIWDVADYLKARGN